MKRSSPSTTGENASETPFARFTRNVRALMAVPKSELDAKVSAAARANKQKRQRRAARG